MCNIAYFDNAATTFPKATEVLNYANNFTKYYGVNAGRGQYDTASAATKMVNETRQELISLLNGTPEHTVIFTPSATIALNMVIQGQSFSNGQIIYISHFEHNAVTRVLHILKQKFNLKIHYLEMSSQKLEYDLAAIKLQFKQNPPDYVICTHASNVCGLIAPIEEICKESKKYGAINIIDMSQTAGLLDIRIASLKVDFCIFAGHKTLNSMLGVGGFICKKNAKINCVIYGGTGLTSGDDNMPKSLPERCEPGSLNTHAIASLNAAIKYIKRVGRQTNLEKESKNKNKLLKTLNKYKNIKIVGDNANSVGIISCVFEGYSSDNIGNILNTRNIAVRTGLHCAPGAHKILGTYPAGTVRFSVSRLNTNDDFSVLDDALRLINES